MSKMLRFVDAAPVVVELNEVSLHVQLTHEHLGAPRLILQLVQVVLEAKGSHRTELMTLELNYSAKKPA